ncbi:helix-turn-helix domain-containing protein [Aquimonas voraii]|uniref:helix-turn-helix domain-containing protein n=1 Tax=Aquimonas voraii TaxID=265719 RepID=UPI0015A1B3DE|nr:helix-turn-helix domain-containing protein [Aquimonas voraii]
MRGVATPLPPGEFTHLRRAPSAALQPFVEHLWCVQWRLPAGAAQRVATVPHPCVHWTFEADTSTLTGPHKRLWQRDLAPQGEVLGIKFRPEGFRAYWGAPVSGLRDLIQPARALPALAFARELGPRLFGELAGGSLDTRFDAIEGTLERALPRLAQEQLQLAVLIDTARDDRELLRADAWAERAALSLRQLQRLLADWVGASPKWILARYRLHEALHRLQQQPAPRLTDLAADTGFADAAHFSRSFRSVLGLSPQQYARLWLS